MGNVSILLYLDTLGKKALLVDDYSEMEIVSQRVCYVEPEFPYFSLLNISGVANGVRVENAKFPLNGAVISCEYQYGISNEPLPGKTAAISLDEGRLLLVRVRRG
jgi:thiamine pyrophosphokinase